MKIIILHITFLLSLYGNGDSILWQKILHHYNNENQIVSNEFYLSNNNSTPKDELLSTISFLKSKRGFETACNFPSRYNFIKAKYKDIPDYDLKSCTELNEYINSFPKDKISIVFTSEYTNNPSSAFGHIMLLFSKDNEPLEIGDAVHFAAKTSNVDNFIKYSYKGFSGEYNGYFIREPFYKKIYEYNTLEQRYMYIYTLDYSKEEIIKVLYHLYELRKASFKYYFLDGNCASQTTHLLNILNTDNYKNDNIYYLPIQTVSDFENRINDKKRFIPLVNKLNFLLNKMSSSEKELFYKIIENQSHIENTYPDIVKEAMVLFTTFNFRKFHNVYKNYENVMEQKYLKENIIDLTPDPLLKTKPSSIGLGYYYTEDNDYLNIQYRPLFIDLFDIQNNDLQESQINTLYFDILLNKKTLKLNKFDLANIKSLPSQLSFYNPLSWSFYSGLNRENRNEDLKVNNEIGIGRTIPLNDFVRSSFLLNAGMDNTLPYIKPFILMNIYPSQNSKLGLTHSYKKYDGDYFYENTIFTSYKYNDYLITAKLINDNSENDNKYLLSIKYNF